MLKLKNRIEFENNLWLAEADTSIFNDSQNDRIEAVTDIASITKGRLEFLEPKTNPKVSKARTRLYNRLLTESAGNPSTPFEFIPITKRINYNEWTNMNKKFVSYKKINNNMYEIYSNLRNEIIENNIIFTNESEEIKDFKIIIGKIPFKVISHLVRHRAFSFMVESSRNKKYLNEVEFWYSDDLSSYSQNKLELNDEHTLQYIKKLVQLKELKSEEATMELSDRRLVLFAMAAWKQNNNAWNNLFKVRGNKTGTQNITKIVIENIKQIINYEKKII